MPAFYGPIFFQSLTVVFISIQNLRRRRLERLQKRNANAARTILEWRGRMGTEDGSRCLMALGDVYAELDDFEEVRANCVRY